MVEKGELNQALLELVGEVKRQLKYFEELGITEYDEPVKQEARDVEPDTAVPRVVPPPEPRLAESPRWSGAPAMVSKKKPRSGSAQASLFGDIAPSAPADEYDLPEAETLEEIRADLGECQRCKLHQYRTNIVFGEGDPDADIMFIGEGPGAEEDVTGRPFVGRAGRLLDRMIEAIGLRREDAYIANVIKSRPPGNRAPEPDEVQACVPFLYRQINAIKPKLIVALGAAAAQTLLQTRTPISKLRGRFFDFRGTKLLPTFHPAFLLRSPNKKREAWEDLKKVRDFLQGESVE